MTRPRTPAYEVRELPRRRSGRLTVAFWVLTLGAVAIGAGVGRLAALVALQVLH